MRDGPSGRKREKLHGEELVRNLVLSETLVVKHTIIQVDNVLAAASPPTAIPRVLHAPRPLTREETAGITHRALSPPREA